MIANVKTIITKLTLTTLISSHLSACTSRIVYDRPVVQASADAVNINTATVDELERLPRVGRRTAEAIVKYREQNGAFRRAEHIMLIRGISESRFVELRPFLKTE